MGRLIISVFACLVLFFLSVSPVSSQLGELGYELNNTEPQDLYIDGNVYTVNISFLGLEDGTYYVNPNFVQPFTRSSTRKLNPDAKGGRIDVTVCGNGKDALKGEGFAGFGGFGGGGKKCKTDGSDYFYEGRAYRLGLYDDKEGTALLIDAAFYVRHSAPRIRISTVDLGTLDGIKVELSGRRPGGEKNNNYQAELQGISGTPYNREQICHSLNKGNVKTIRFGDQKNNFTDFDMGEENPKSFDFRRGKENESGLLKGSYLLKINEHIDEQSSWKPDFNIDDCQGGFTYVQIPLTFTAEGLVIGKAEYDPVGEETFREEELLKTAPIPCMKINRDNGQCEEVRTAIGPIKVSQEGFVKSIFTFILTIAGFGATIIIIYSGYIIITSRANKERIAAARETLTSAIVGLLFIIFAIVMLEIIGVDILRIPGLTR